MRENILILPILLLFSGCLPRPMALNPKLPQTYLQSVSFESLEGWETVSYEKMLALFKTECHSSKTRYLYGELCTQAANVSDAKNFFHNAFEPYRIVEENGKKEGLITGYYEPLLHGSKTKTERFRYPLYGVPDDLVTVKLGELYPELKGMRLRGRLEGNTVVPYLSREEMEQSQTGVICWVDDRVALFFLEVQGSGRIRLESGETLYIGYGNQNGHPYRSIGKQLVESGQIPKEEISLQSIREWFQSNPERIDEVLHTNPSKIFFRQKKRAASGALGFELTPGHSVAVDPRFIPLGAMLYMQTNDPLTEAPIRRAVFAQDTGGAIKGALRADLFWGYGKEAELKAGKMQEELRLWILLPKTQSGAVAGIAF